jgi:hypothetical protein
LTAPYGVAKLRVAECLSGIKHLLLTSTLHEAGGGCRAVVAMIRTW